jgi:hypothetical protein
MIVNRPLSDRPLSDQHRFHNKLAQDPYAVKTGTLPAMQPLAQPQSHRHRCPGGAKLKTIGDARAAKAGWCGSGCGVRSYRVRDGGHPFVHGAFRFERPAETGQIAKLAPAGEPFSFDGTHHQVQQYTPHLRPIQQPRVPVLVGGGGRRLLTFAAT